MAQRSEQADRVLDLAREEADLLGHRYLGPEHLILGVLREGGSGASRVLEANGVNLAAAREALGRLVDRGVVPGPRPSDAELLGSLGIDLEAIRRTTEQSFGGKALGWAVREATRARRRGLGECREGAGVPWPGTTGELADEGFWARRTGGVDAAVWPAAGRQASRAPGQRAGTWSGPP